MLEFSRAAKTGFTRPEVWQCNIPFDNAPAQHATLLQNFTDAILDGVPLLVPGAEGIHSVELANAMLYSSIIGEDVRLPLNAYAYEVKLQELIANSKFEKKVVQTSAEDFSKSFNR